jgi:hypothetical protein
MIVQSPGGTTRPSMSAVSRRASLPGLGVALTTVFAAVTMAGAKKKGRKSALQRCKKQEGQCHSFITTFCAEEAPNAADCEARLAPCCAPFAGCDADGAYRCILRAFGAPV